MGEVVLVIGDRAGTRYRDAFDGVEVVSAEDFLEGLHLFKEHEPVAVVLDQRCPHKTLNTVIGFRENRLPEARFLALVDIDDHAVPAFRRRIGIYGVQEVDRADAPVLRLRAALDRLVGTALSVPSPSTP